MLPIEGVHVPHDLPLPDYSLLGSFPCLSEFLFKCFLLLRLDLLVNIGDGIVSHLLVSKLVVLVSQAIFSFFVRFRRPFAAGCSVGCEAVFSSSDGVGEVTCRAPRLSHLRVAVDNTRGEDGGNNHVNRRLGQLVLV